MMLFCPALGALQLVLPPFLCPTDSSVSGLAASFCSSRVDSPLGIHQETVLLFPSSAFVSANLVPASTLRCLAIHIHLTAENQSCQHQHFGLAAVNFLSPKPFAEPAAMTPSDR
ncbi:hypothetical protein LZ31DRAFT_323805 [Colletotrichum somersetense]|nr:hypothetical protein LZ31DRAFT_323805 [Colletotrichum somersetense]